MEYDSIGTFIIVTARGGLRIYEDLTGAILSDITFCKAGTTVLTNVQTKDVNPRVLAGKLSRRCVIMGSYVGDDAGKPDSARYWTVTWFSN